MQKKRFLMGFVTIFVAFILAFTNKEVKADVTGDWVYDNLEYQVVITGYIGSATEVVVPDKINGKPVISVKGAFYNNDRITGVYIPGTVERLEADYSVYPAKGVFGECDNLKSVSGCDNVNAYAEGTFYKCLRLSYVNIPKANSIPGQMFYGCKSLKKINIPNSVTLVDYRAFENCENLITVTGGSCVKKYGTEAFQNCYKLKNITLGNADSVSSYMFYKCKSLKKIKIPNTVTNIQKGAFARSGLTSIRIPDSVKYIGGDLYDPAYSLANGAFANCSNLKKVFGCKGVVTYGKAVFHNCTKLESLSLGKVGYISKDMFRNCNKLKKINIPSSVRSINDNAFANCKNLKSVKLPSKLENIRPGAFLGCKGISAMKIPKKVTRVYENSFSKNIKLRVYKKSYAARVFPNAKKI